MPPSSLFKIAVSAFIIKDQKLLLLKRRDDETFLPGTWEVPGGGIEANESIETGLKREIKEEAGLDILPKQLFSHFEYIDGEGQKTANLNFFCQMADSTQLVNIASGEMQEASWVNADELTHLPLTSIEMEVACKQALHLPTP